MTVGRDAATEPTVTPTIPWWAFACLALVFAAVGLELVGGSLANSPVPALAEVLAPIAWPQWLRVAWWIVIAAAAGAYRLAERRAGIRRHPLVMVISVAPFLAFAVGIAVEADWATWH